MARWNTSHCGCYAESAQGHQHVRNTLADLLDCLQSWSPLIPELRKEMSDDASEEDEALTVLNLHCDGCFWELLDGELMLTAEEI